MWVPQGCENVKGGARARFQFKSPITSQQSTASEKDNHRQWIQVLWNVGVSRWRRWTMLSSLGIMFGDIPYVLVDVCTDYARAVVVAGVGLYVSGMEQIPNVCSYTDAYDLFAVNFANLMVGYVYTSSGTLAASDDTAIKIATSSGTVIGQLGFGFLADHLGRKKVYPEFVFH